MDIKKIEEDDFVEIALVEVSKELAVAPEYKNMIEHINDKLPAIRRDSENFYKSASQFKNVTLDVTELTPMGSLKHILAVINRTRTALEEGHISLRRKQIELKKKTAEYDKETDIYDKELLWVDIVELNTQMANIENSIKGALRKMSFFTTQYQAIMEKLGKDEITEKDYEMNESRHHIMTAMKQALNAARTRGGIIDEGNHSKIRRSSNSRLVHSSTSMQTARDALKVYAPLAQRMGMQRLKSQIENTAFRILYPRQYDVSSVSIVFL